MHGAAHFRCYVSYSEHVRAKLIKANKCLFVLRSLRKEGFSQGEVDHLFSALVLPNFTYGLPVYGAVDSDLTVIQNVLDRCFKRKYTFEKLFKVLSVDPDCPLSNIIPKKKETMYQLRNKSAHRPDIKTERFKNVFVNRLIFRYNLLSFYYLYIECNVFLSFYYLYTKCLMCF